MSIEKAREAIAAMRDDMALRFRSLLRYPLDEAQPRVTTEMLEAFIREVARSEIARSAGGKLVGIKWTGVGAPAQPAPTAEDEDDDLDMLWLDETLGGLEGKHGEGWINITMKERRLFARLLRERIRRFDTSTPAQPAPADLSLINHLTRQRAWSLATFGPGDRTQGVLDHIRKELTEIEEKPNDLSEWIDVVILALDGAWRQGYEPEEIAAAITAKQTKNEARKWPDWRTADPDRAIEHVREIAQPAPAAEDGGAEPAPGSADDPATWRDDAAKWAAAFNRTAASLGHRGMDEGWLIGWFANAIERSHDLRSRAATARIRELEGERDEANRSTDYWKKRAYEQRRRAEAAEASLAILAGSGGNEAQTKEGDEPDGDDYADRAEWNAR